jgi:hypothetical protein
MNDSSFTLNEMVQRYDGLVHFLFKNEMVVYDDLITFKAQ